jgi:hypothetical protein
MRIRTIAVLTAPFVLFMAFVVQAAPLKVVYIESIGPPYTIDDLLADAEVVAVVRPTGAQADAWNSTDGRHWVAQPGDPGRSLIYSDEQVEVLRALRGSDEAMMTIRNIGGVSDGYRMVINGLDDLKAGTVYLVFLKQFETPTEAGFEAALSFVGQGHGVFRRVDGEFINSFGLVIDEEEVDALR